MQTIINIIVFVLVLGTIIFIHELGHFIAAKSFGVYCAEFSLGMGPKVFAKKVGETEYQLRLLPIGGFVAMAGEADQEDNELMKDVPHERTLKGIHTWKRCVVMLAGVFMNFVLALVLLIGVFSFSETGTNSTIIGDVVAGDPAAEAGLQAGDNIQSFIVDGEEYLVASYEDIQKVLIDISEGKTTDTLTMEVVITRNNQEVKKTVEAKYNEEASRYKLGISEETRSLTFGEAVKYSFKYFKEMSTLIFTTLAKLVTDSANTVGQLSGPAGIYQATAQITESGSISNLLLLTAGLSVNIGIFNLLPIPGLDGSQVLFALIEKVVGKEIPIKVKYVIQLAGLALVFGLMIFVTINDISKIFT
ncbi:MAG: M50 family metallopeptidase [Coprobacillaceae bacterium]